MISEKIIEEIKLKLGKVNRHPECYDKRVDLVRKSLKSLGDVYSFWIENPKLRKNLLLENKSEKTIAKLARKGIQSVRNGWYDLIENHKHGYFIDDLNSDVIRYVNGLVQGGTKEDGKFRKNGKVLNDSVTLNIEGFMPINADKIPDEINRIIVQIKKKYSTGKLELALESAIYAHLALTLTQPFRDGNKRTARLIQDRILYDAQLPPVVITAGEGKFYFDLIARTARPYKNGDEEGQRQFFDYCASKVNNGLDEILGDIHEQ